MRPSRFPGTLAFLLLAPLSACTEGGPRVISEISDVQAWREYSFREASAPRGESGRTPASGEESLETRLSAISPREVLFSCSGVATQEVCYREVMIRRFDEAWQIHGKSLNGNEAGPAEINADYRKEQGRFLASVEYDRMMQKVDRFHRELFSGIEISARGQLHKLFSECEKAPEGEARIERFDLVGGITTEMPKAVYACLVAGWKPAAERVVTDSAARLGVRLESPGACDWVRQRQVFPLFESELQLLLKSREKSEAEALEKLKPSLRNEIHPFQTDEQAIARFAPELRKRFPYTRVEQWILALKNSQ